MSPTDSYAPINRVQGIENGPHTLVFGQDAVSAGKNGVTLDYYVVDDIVAPGSTAVWR